jgi:hypothetical protein
MNIVAQDVLSIACEIRIPGVSSDDVQFVLENYDDWQAEDPDGDWGEIVCLLYTSDAADQSALV